MRYKAFISYSHAADGKLAPALEKSLERFAKPWNRVRAFDVFRDQSDLGVNPGLWASVEEALGQAEFFLLLASPEAAASRWVPKEVAFWKERRSPDHLLLVLTEGEITWDAASGDFDWDRTTALPRSMEGVFKEEPLYLDLRWARTENDLGLDHPRFREAIAGLAATLHGKPKADLDSEEVRQARKTRRLARGAIAGLSLLFLSTAVGFWIANERARIATSRQLAAAAVANLPQDPELSVLLALEAAELAKTNEGAAALHAGVHASRIRQTLTGHTGAVFRVAISPDGRRLATASFDGTARVWDAETGDSLLTLPHAREVADLAFSPDGKRLATAGWDGMATIWDAKTGETLLTLPGRRGVIVTGLAYSADGNRLATASFLGTTVWNASTGDALLTLADEVSPVMDVAFGSDGRLATANAGSGVRVWDAETGASLRTLSGHTDSVFALAFSPDSSRLATGGRDRTARVWDAQTGEQIVTLAGHASEVRDVAFSVDGTWLATASADGTAKVWDAETGEELVTLAGHRTSVRGVAFFPDRPWLATVSEDATAKVWDWAIGGDLLTLTGHAGPVRGLAFSADGRRLATAGADSTATVWDAETGDALMTLTGHTDTVFAVAFSLDGRRLATASADSTATIWDAESGAELLKLTGHTRAVRGVAFSPDGRRLATASDDATARVWNAETGDTVVTLTGHRLSVRGVAFSPDGRRVATAGVDFTGRLWDVETGDSLRATSAPGSLRGLAFSPDGRLLATAGTDGTAKVSDATTLEHQVTLTGHTAEVSGVAFSPDGRRVATASDDGTARVWDAETGQYLMTLAGHRGAVVGVAFSADGRRLVTASADGTARIWALDIDLLKVHARQRITRSLTSEECRLYQVTCPESPVSPVAAQTTYSVYYLGGQSNMDGFGQVAELPAELRDGVPGVLIFHGNQAADDAETGGSGLWAELEPGHGWGFSSDGVTNSYGPRFGVELTFAHRLRELDPDARIALIKYSRGGTSIDLEAGGPAGTWDPDYDGATGVNQYDHFLATIRNAFGARDIDGDGSPDELIPAGIVWMQGESDAGTEEIARRYEANLTRLIQLIRAALRVDDLPVVIGRISDSGQDEADGKVWDYGEIVREAQARFAEMDCCAALVASTDGYAYSDPWHYDSAGFLDLGRRFAEAMFVLERKRSIP